MHVNNQPNINPPPHHHNHHNNNTHHNHNHHHHRNNQHHLQHLQHLQQSARNRPVSTPVPMNYSNSRYPDIHPPPPIPHHNSSRRGNMFGSYLLLQTLGEGEFGKVKLGVHVDTGEEVAIKLIRKESVDTPSRLTKIEREIGVLRSVMHPNIVKLYDVFETDRYIGIIMEYASGGELFDHILVHRYLKERDACRLFSQLISGVNYLHQKNIVHRDLKLENLLLDRNRNIIITDFGFANKFNGSNDDLMATSCGSPCYAAPELVISEGLYVGSAVDIWSCGVILYAMLSGYLPFDDDPSNPDGDNINLLYKYIINTPLVFPDYVSSDAKDLLRKMLVPDPTRRCDMKTIMSHRWLLPCSSIFERSIRELEAAANPLHSLSPPQSHLKPGISVHNVNTNKKQKNNNYLTTEYIADQSNNNNNGLSPPPTVKRHTIQVEYDYPDNDNNTINNLNDNDNFVMNEIENGMKFVDYPDEDFLFVDGTRLGSTIPSATSDSVVDGIENQIKNDTLIPINDNNNINGNDNNNDNEIINNSNNTLDKHHSISSTASATSCKSSETMATNTPPGTPSTTTRNSANAGSGLFTLFESDSITKNNNNIDKINGEDDEKINDSNDTEEIIKVNDDNNNNNNNDDGFVLPQEQIQQNGHLLKPSDQNDAQHLAQQPNNTITLVVPGEIESHKNSSYAPKQRDNSRTRPVTVHGPLSSLSSSSPTSSTVAVFNNNNDSSLLSTIDSKKDNTINTSNNDNNSSSSSSSNNNTNDNNIINSTSQTITSSAAATKSSPSTQKKSSQSHKRALSTEIVYKLLGNSKSNSLTSDFNINKTNKSTSSPSAATTIKTSDQSQKSHLNNNNNNDTNSSDTASESTTSYLDELNVIDSRSKRHDGKRKALSLMVDSFKSPSGQPNLSVLSNNTTLTTKEKRKTISATSSGSSNAAKKVMDWFRRKSLAKQDIPITIDNDNVEQAAASTPDLTSNNNNGRSSKNNIFKKPKNNNNTNNNPSVVVTQPNSIANSSSSSRQSTMTSINLNVDAKLRVHNGALDQLALTERPPYEVFIVVKQTLLSMGIEIRREGEFKVKCLRRKRKGGVPIDNNFYSNNDNNGNKSASQVSESTESLDVNTEKKRKKYSSTPFKTLLRRTSSNNTNQLASLHPIITAPSSQQQQQQNKSEYLSPQTPDSSSLQQQQQSLPVSTSKNNNNTIDNNDNNNSDGDGTTPITSVATNKILLSSSSYNNNYPMITPEVIYGDPTVDSGEEVRFSVELCRIKNLPGLYIVDIKRLKGNRWSYKFLYHTLLDRLDLKGQSGYLTIGTSGGLIY